MGVGKVVGASAADAGLDAAVPQATRSSMGARGSMIILFMVSSFALINKALLT
jgi:hypothetical protein